MNVEPRLKWKHNIATILNKGIPNPVQKLRYFWFWYPNISLKVLLTFDLKYHFTTFVMLIILDVSNFFRVVFRIKIPNVGQSAQFL